MYDACVLYKVSEKVKNRLNIQVGNASIKKGLNFNRKGLNFLSPGDEKVLRQGVDDMLPFGIINSELIHKRDSVHYARSGIDDTVMKLMSEKKIALVFNLSLLLNNKLGERARLIKRMKVNMKRGVKYDVPILLASCAKSKYELFSGVEIKKWSEYLGIDSFKRVEKSFKKIFK